MTDCHIGIFGAGIVGLNTALELQKQLRNARITIISDKFQEDTTSDKAAGLFRQASYFSGPTPEITDKWINNSYQFYKDLIGEPNAGVKELSGYILSRKSQAATEDACLKKVLPVSRKVDEDELSHISPGDWKYGTFITSCLVESRQYQPWAMKKFTSNGGRIIRGKINSFSNVKNYGKFDVVINCTGLGAKSLCNDRSLIPIRGQVIKVSAPWVDKFYMDDDDTYIIPGIWAVTLGGTRNYGNWNTSISKHDSLQIMDLCSEILPQLVRAPVLQETVGLRPHRDIVRVEPEVINGLKVVHEYGHGGYGITSSPGTAQDATSIAIDLLKSTSYKL